MDKPPALPLASGSSSPARTLSTQLSSLSESVKPASEEQVAVELEKLRAVFGYDMAAWRTAAGLYIEALRDLPYDLLREAVAVCIRTAGPGDHFPKPGAIRATVHDVLEVRKARLKRAQTPKHDEEWPKWLEEIWGRLPQGRIDRNLALVAAQQKKIASTQRLAEVSRLMREHGYTVDQAWLVWAGGVAQPGEPMTPGSLAKPLERVRQAMGVSATERKVPKHEDPEELRKAAIELGILQEAE
jgi:hypothetical protein